MDTHSTGNLHLTGTWLRLAWLAWVVTVLITVSLTLISLSRFPEYIQLAGSGLLVDCDLPQGPTITGISRTSTAARTDIKVDDLLLVYDGEAITAGNCATLISATRARYGDAIHVTVQTGNEPAREVSFVRTSIRSVTMGALLKLNLSIPVATVAMFVLEAIHLLVFWGLSIILMWQRRNDGIAILTAILLIGGGFRFSGILPAITDNRVDYYIVTYAIILYGYFGIFPNGRFVPRWVVVLWAIYSFFSFNWAARLIPSLNTYFLAVDMALLLCVVASQVYRYWHETSGTQRLQTKWVVFGFVVGVGGFYVPRLIELLGITTLAPIEAILTIVVRITTLIVPLAIGFAILRFRLFEIDLVINRSLVYGTVTLALLALFLVATLLLQKIVGETNSGIAYGFSAVGVGLLFNPARKRLQSIVDRQLYGFRFDQIELKKAQKLREITNPGILTGQQMGPYQLTNVIGRGGMGEVYGGVSETGTAAIKILPDEVVSKTPEFLKRFQREAQTLSALDHPNIVKIYGSGESNGLYYIAMEYIVGRELNLMLKERGRIPLDEARGYIRDIAAALDYAHEHGLVHRDIKPANIIIVGPDEENETRLSHETVKSNRPNAILMDFGIAKVHDAKTNITGTGAIGTIDYMSPEQIMTARDVDHRADIYALGIVAYEMLTGEKPFKGSSAQIMFAHIQQPPPDPRTLAPEVSTSIAKAIMKAMDKDPDERYSKVEEFAVAFM